MKNKFVKQIISGKFKGARIELPATDTTRSSKTIVLESFFNTIQFDIIDANFVEVFSGSGSIGLEALSRGAKKVYFMEQNREALRALKENISRTDPSSCQVYAGNSFENINMTLSALGDEEAYFYIDPPFSIREGMEDIYDKTINLIKNLKEKNVKLIIVEHMTGLELADEIGLFKKKKSKKFGKTSLTYFTQGSE